MADKWYNSDFASYLGGGLAVAAICLGIGYGVRGCTPALRAKVVPIIQQADINGNSMPDKFYVVDGKIAVVELDGKSLAGSSDTKRLEE